MCNTVMAAGWAGSAGGSVKIAFGIDCAKAQGAGPMINRSQSNTERMVNLSAMTGLVPRPRNPRFDILEFSRKCSGQQTITCRRDDYLILDAYTEAAIRQVDSRFDSEDRAGSQRLLIKPGIVHVETDKMAEAMNEILQIPRAAQVLFRHMLQLRHRDAWTDCRENVLLSLVHRPIYLGLLVTELARHRIGARDVRGISPILGGRINHHKVAILKQPGVLVPMQDG